MSLTEAFLTESGGMRGLEAGSNRVREDYGAAVGPWSPADLTGLNAWYDAADAASFTYHSGAVVSQWSDLSGNGNHFVQATSGEAPTRTGTLNGLPTVRAASKTMSRSSPGLVSSQMSISAIIKMETGVGNARCIEFVPWDSTGCTFWNGGQFPNCYSSGGNFSPSSGGLGFSWGLMTAVFNGTTFEMWLNGVSVGSRADTTPFNVTILYLNRGTSGDIGDHSYAEIVITEAAFTSGERADVEAYLTEKWAPPTIPLITETFTGTNGAAWPMTYFNYVSNNGTRQTIQNNKGQSVTDSGAFSAEYLYLTEGPPDFLLMFDMVVVDKSLGGYFQIQFRQNTGGGGGFPAYVSELELGGGFFAFSANSTGGTAGSSSGTVPTFVSGDTLHWKVRAAGVVIQIKVWRNAEPEPSTWNIDVTDTGSTKLGGPGEILILPKCASSGAVTTLFDNIVLYDTPDPVLP